VTRIEWTRTEPGDIEHLVAMLLCRENPAATHIRPSRGDGGIDVLGPADDGSGIIVYQVKSFHSNLTASQKAQVERSFHRLVDFAKAHDLKVLEWYLTLPLDPTTENLLDWLPDHSPWACDGPSNAPTPGYPTSANSAATPTGSALNASARSPSPSPSS
jgi:hypothetical protein